MSNASEIHQYHTQLISTLQAAFPSVQTLAAYRINETLATPAILIEVEGMTVGKLNSMGKTPLNLSMALHCVLGHGTPNLELEVRNFASQVMNLLTNQYFNLPDLLEAPQNISAQPGEFKPGKSGFDSFVVTFEQVIYVGEGAFDLTGVPAVEIHFNQNEVVVT